MKSKKQPSAEVYREQLRLAADEIIRLRQWKFWYESMGLRAPWWQQWKRFFRTPQGPPQGTPHGTPWPAPSANYSSPRRRWSFA